MSKVVYLEDRKNGLHTYCSEMGERKPQTIMTARMSYYGDHYFVTTKEQLKGRGITKIKEEYMITYKVTQRAFEKLQKQYPISLELKLD